MYMLTGWWFLSFGGSYSLVFTVDLIQITENVPKTLSKAPCLVAKRMSLTLHLLLFAQSM